MKLSIRTAATLSAIGLLVLGTAVSAPAQRTGQTRPAPALKTSGDLDGTFRWNPSKSENIADVVRTAGDMTDTQRQEVSGFLKESETIGIEIRGTSVTVSEQGKSSTFVADGRLRPDSARGAGAKVRASVRGSELTVSRIDGPTDVTTVYSVSDDRDEMKVTRRVTTSYLTETVFTETFYDRTSSTSDVAVTDEEDSRPYSSNDPSDRPGTRSTGSATGSATGSGSGRRPQPNRPANFIVPNGTIVTGILENDIITGVSQDNDRFRLTVNAPSEFKGAVITGYLTGVSRSGKVSGRAQITFNFETIRLPNGRTYDFGGYINSITDPTGKTVKTDTEGTVKGDSQTRETAKRSGIGAGIGAVLGGIVGGGNGAVLGAIIGGGAGAGSVVMQGKDDIKLVKGTVINVQASAPR